MKKKYLLSSLFLTLFLSACSYGSVSTINPNQFREFYNSGDLATQKNHDFAVGENISLVATYEDLAGNFVIDSFDLQTSSISSWESKKLGNKLSFSQISFVYENEEDDDTTFELYNDCYLIFTSKNVKEELDEEEADEEAEAPIIGKEDSYTFQKTYESINNITGEKYSLDQSFVELRYYDSENNGKTFSSEPSYQKRTKKTKSYQYEITENEEKTERHLVELDSSETIAYTENFEGESTRKILSYTLDIKTTSTIEKKVNGVYEGYSREIVKTNYKTSYNEVLGTQDKGEKNDSHDYYNYVDGTYKKDDEQSTSSKDETYRYEVNNEFIAQFDVDNLITAFKEDDDLHNILLVNLNNMMKNYFNEFEGYMNDDSIGEEIIKYAQNYQYRAKIDDETVYQYTFFDDSGTHDTLSSITVFKVDAKGQLEAKYFISIIY